MIRLVMLFLGFAWPFLLKAFWWLIATLGVGFITYAGVSNGLEYLLQGVVAGKNQLAGVGGEFAGAVAVFADRFGMHLLLAGIAAGYTSRIALAGVSTLKRMIFKT